MTTIATDGRSMAGDGLTTAGNCRVAQTVKVFRTTDGRIYGGCGPSTSCKQFTRWMDGEIEKPDLSDDFEALILNADGTVDWIDHKLQLVPYLSPMAVGSGSDVAIGAMLAGKSPLEAVEIAKLRDIRTGGDVTTLHIEPASLKAVA